MTRRRVGVIGGGIFGVSAALELASHHDVVLFERSEELLRGATYANHNRHHYGFHYPRSRETARQCLRARSSFEALYAGALVSDFSNYYCVASRETKTTASAYVAFCHEVGLSFEEAWPPEGVIDRSRIALSIKVDEPVYDHGALMALLGERIRGTRGITIECGSQVVGGHITAHGTKVLDVVGHGGTTRRELDFLINATYAENNRVCEWFGFEPRLFQFNLQELAVIRLPGWPRLGLTIQDGSFPSFLPLGHTDEYLFAHVDASQLVREVSTSRSGLLARQPYVCSNWENILRASVAYAPILKKAVYVRSIFVDRVVDANRSADDARMSEITAHGSGCWSIFGAKVITAVETARALRALVEAA